MVNATTAIKAHTKTQSAAAARCVRGVGAGKQSTKWAWLRPCFGLGPLCQQQFAGMTFFITDMAQSEQLSVACRINCI